MIRTVESTDDPIIAPSKKRTDVNLKQVSAASLEDQFRKAKPPLSARSGRTDGTYQTHRSGVSKRTTAGRKAIKVIEWYFYPEFAPKKLFKNKSVQ